MRVILDTNFLMYSATFHGDILEEIEKTIGRRGDIVVLRPVYTEIQSIAHKNRGKAKRQAKIALDFIKKKEINVVNVKQLSCERVDDLIVRFARTCRCYVATNDKVLRGKLNHEKIPVLYIRQGNRIGVTGRLY